MTSTTFEINNQQREACAVSVMRTMLADYSNEKGIPFSCAFFEFLTSPAYKMLFDYSTGLWMEGPDDLRNIFVDTRCLTVRPAKGV